MGLSIDIEPDLFAFAKNNIIISGNVLSSDSIITEQSNNSCIRIFTTAKGGIIAGKTFAIVCPNLNNGLGINITFNITASPSSIFDIKDFVSYNKPILEWLNYFTDCLFKIPFIADNFDAGIDTRTANTFIFALRAKEKGTLWNFNIVCDFFSVSQNEIININSSANDTLDNVYAICHVYKNKIQSGGDGNTYLSEKLFSLKSFLDANLKFRFSLASDLKKYLKPYLVNTTDTLHLSSEHFKYIVELKYRNNLLGTSEVVTSTNETYLYENKFHGYLAGRAFYDSIGKDINLDYFANEQRLFLTRKPKITYFGEAVIVQDLILNDDEVATNQLFSTVQFMYENGTTEIIDIPNIFRIENKLAFIEFNFNDAFFNNIFSGKFPVSVKYQIKNLDRLQATPMEELSGKFSETREIIFNRKYFRHNNYFRFFGSLAGSEFAWFNGKIEASNESTAIEFERDISQKNANYGDEDTIWNEFQFGKEEFSVSQKFKISTGFKTKEEIQWLTEMLSSELIQWYTKNQMLAYINNKNGLPFDENDLFFYYINIDKNSVKYYDGDDELQSMSFEFKIAMETNTAHFIIKDELKPLPIAKDVFVIDVRQAQLYSENFNPKVVIKIADNYKLGDTLTISFYGLASDLNITIVDENSDSVDTSPYSDDLQFSSNITDMYTQLLHVFEKYSINQFDPAVTTGGIFLSNRTLPVSDFIAFNCVGFATKKLINCNNIWNDILSGKSFAKVAGYNFANGTNFVYLYEILKQNVHNEGVATYYSTRFPNDLEAWIECIRTYINEAPEFDIVEVDDRGLIKFKYRIDGPLNNSNTNIIGMLDKNLFITKLLD